MTNTPKNFSELVGLFIGILTPVISLIFAITLLIIVWKLIDAWIINPGDTKKLDEGRQYAIWGIIGLVVMSTIWAIVRMIQSSLFGG
ncbi:hypothetical protein A2392_02825 [Candidatus Kaiserbacteria bacterium RIFOXYB1_FULL_46_14]|uniref:Uncharacterized protein n=1 Tax=Candidatus Kaiserbacteria bacterium RIFOXYB1_FULL_46_14 TaxID=1798531 RepID=A0A1F6FIM9_9BACT|nr:MAG: hypothetical protein A2392_02825 [Candidatus Kaiserbacteria bacterium RIFOXYB1_FULL_46_14]